MSNALNIGIAGLGTVGVGVVKILSEKADLLAARSGKKLSISAVSARDKSKDRGIDVSSLTWHDDALGLALDDNVDLVVELIGGADGVAYDLCKAALENGKSVVTANKALIATHGVELAEIAEKNNASLALEAAVAGGIPILKGMKEGLAGNDISRVQGILNGTCNYILTAMEADQASFDDVLKEAQELGYAEADPTFDVDGIDTAHKLAILTSIAFGVPVNLDAMGIEGIRSISLSDIAYAAELGYTIKLLGIAARNENGIEQRVHPCMVPDHSPVAQVEGVLNAVAVECDALGPVFFEGAGAGEGPTASAVVADIVDIASGRASHPFGVPVSALKEQNFTDINDHVGEYYVKFTVEDKSGVLAAITGALSDESIGVERVLQPPPRDDGTADIVIVTHATNETSMKKTLKEISKMEYVIEAPHVIRMEA